MCYVYLETERFTIRQWKFDDVTALWKIMSDRRVHRFTGDTPWTKERTTKYIQFMVAQNFRTLETFHDLPWITGFPGRAGCVLFLNPTLDN